MDVRDALKKITVYAADPSLLRRGVFLNDIGVVPDRVKNYPLEVQETYRQSFNANLEAYGSVEFAMEAANRAIKSKLAQIERRRQQRTDRTQLDENLLIATERFKRARRPKIQIVVP